MKNLILFLKIIIFATIVFIIILEAIIIVGGRNNYSDDANYIIVLGAKLHGDRPSKSLKYRMDIALDKMKQNPNTILIATGGQGDDETIPEAIAIKNYFLKNGIDGSRIMVEDKSTNTNENFKFARKLINKKGNIKVNVVSNKYHICRAKILAGRNGFEPYGLPAKTPKSVFLKSYLRESLALVKSFILDK